MKNFNNELEITRGETFSLDRTLENKDGTPFIISNKLTNPYFLITVSTTKYQQENRYVYNKWLDLSDFPKFNETNVVNLKQFTTEENGTTLMYPNGFDSDNIQELKTVQIGDKTISDICAYGYVGDKLLYYQVNDALFYFLKDDGTINYKYWNTNENKWTEYKCRIVVPFLHHITVNWTEQDYVYNIALVGGQSTIEYLRSICEILGLLYTETDTKLDLYIKLKNYGYVFPEDFSIEKPLGIVDFSIPILKSTKLTVSTDIVGGDYE